MASGKRDFFLHIANNSNSSGYQFNRYFTIECVDRQKPWIKQSYPAPYQMKYKQNIYLAWLYRRLIEGKENRRYKFSLSCVEVRGKHPNQDVHRPLKLLELETTLFQSSNQEEYRMLREIGDRICHLQSMEYVIGERCLFCKNSMHCKSNHWWMYFLQLVNNPKAWIQIDTHLFVTRARITRNHRANEGVKDKVSFLVNSLNLQIWVVNCLSDWFQAPVLLDCEESWPLLHAFLEYQTEYGTVMNLEMKALTSLYKEWSGTLTENFPLPESQCEKFWELSAAVLPFDWCIASDHTTLSLKDGMKYQLLGKNLTACCKTSQPNKSHWHSEMRDPFMAKIYSSYTFCHDLHVSRMATMSAAETDSEEEELDSVAWSQDAK